MASLKVLLWCGTGHNQVALANLISENHHLAGIVVDLKKRKKKKRFSLRQLLQKAVNRLFFPTINGAWFGMLTHFSHKYSDWPDVPILKTNSINSKEAFLFSQSKSPDVILVSGTGLVKKKMLGLSPPHGILNLHTGLSPYVKGGPNCTNWCLAEDQFHLIGNTIMWIDPGVDSGNLVTTALVDFEGDENLEEIQIKVMEHAHRLYLSVLDQLAVKPQKLPNVPQAQIGVGKTYYSKMWTFRRRMDLLNNFRRDRFRAVIGSEDYKKKRETIKLVTL